MLYGWLRGSFTDFGESFLSTLERAIAIAAEAHAGQADKAGVPYILHPLRMMLSLASAEERIVAVLHDVCEDCPGWSFERLRSEGFSSLIIEALDSVTKREGEDYEAFIRRAASNPIGQRVKLADLNDNCDLSRISAPSPRDMERIGKYREAISLLRRLSGGSDACEDRACATRDVDHRGSRGPASQ